MNKRLFFKILSWATLGALSGRLIPKPDNARHYISRCRWGELVGIRFRWPCRMRPNPSPGRDWVIFEKCPNPMFWNGKRLNNDRLALFLARPIGKSGPLELMHFGDFWDGKEVDYQTANLYPDNTFYKT